MDSETVSPSIDRRTRKHHARRQHLLDLAADIVDDGGVESLTMGALAEAADYATASLYTYFKSRSALIAALQQSAIVELKRASLDELDHWNRALRDDYDDLDTRVAALARLWGFSDLFLAAPRRYPREFQLQQRLLVSPGHEDVQDAATVVPTAMEALDLPRQLLADAVACGALDDHTEVIDPIGNTVEGALVRTFAWVVALNGALLTDQLTTGLPTDGWAIGGELTASLLRGWGAPAADLNAAREIARKWSTNTSSEGVGR